MQNNIAPRADWFPNTFLSPEFAEGTVPIISTIEDSLWDIRRTPEYQGPEWMTIIADRGFTEGSHYFEIKVIKSCKFMISVLSPEASSLITRGNLAAHPGAAGNPLLSENYSTFYSNTQSTTGCVRNIHDMKIDDNMTPLREAMLASGIKRDFFNSIADDPNKVCVVRDHRNVSVCEPKKGFGPVPVQQIYPVQQFVNGAISWEQTLGHLQRNGRNCTYSHPMFDWTGCRVGFLMDLDRAKLFLLVYFAGNHSTSYDEADKRVLFAVLGRGRRYYPAISMQGCNGALELRTSTELPAGYGDVAGQLAEARAQVEAGRALIAEMDGRLELQQAELLALHAQLEQQQQEQQRG